MSERRATMKTYEADVRGMTCDHCAAAVAEAAQSVDGVEDVAVDRRAGTLRVRAAADVDRARLSDAVDAAGYGLQNLREVP
jgi:copper chaperone CopZ